MEILSWGPHTGETYESAAQDTQFVRNLIDDLEKHPLPAESPQAKFVRYLIQIEHRDMSMSQAVTSATDQMVVDSSENEWK